MLCVSGNGAIQKSDWLPSSGWRPAPHHFSSKKLWETIQQEAREEAVRGYLLINL
jgi:hypothetical protein